MGGGGGGGGRYSRSTPELEARIGELWSRERERLEGDIARMLQQALAKYNGRDRELTRERLEQIEQALGERVALDKILFGGSVAKHTEVDGISDVDGLVLLDREDLRGASAQVVRAAFLRALNESLPRGDIANIRDGHMAVTVTYRDGMEIQLVPAVRRAGALAVPIAGSGAWVNTEPEAFRKQLAKANDRLDGALVPAIKLFKALVANFPEQKRLSGYHMEALGVEAAKTFKGSNTPKDLLIHLLESAATGVLRHIKDSTGQSKTVDDYLGIANSAERRNVALALDGMRRKLTTATSVAEWRNALGEET